MTQKQILSVVKRSHLTIISFGGSNDRRMSTYSGLNVIQAFIELNNHVAMGRKCICTDETGTKAIHKMEFGNGRAKFEDCEIYAMRVNAQLDLIPLV